MMSNVQRDMSALRYGALVLRIDLRWSAAQLYRYAA
jgi:hypothetical protein